MTISGQDDDRTRASAAHLFAESTGLILITTDSFAEGLNLHRRCFHLLHLDLPYNPNRLEQRNGRIDRYGQSREPEIRYLYIPGTFEESLLLRLIAKYEKARAALDVMPDTLGVTADAAAVDATLTSGLSEEPADLFGPETEIIRTLDRAAEATSPASMAELMREIDRAFDAFELMAVSHGWHGLHGINASAEQLARAERSMGPSPPADDLPTFVGAVIEAETGRTASRGDEIRLPANWTHGLDGLPGYDASSAVLRFTRDVDEFRDPTGRDVGFLGRAHPLAFRAIRHGCQLGGAVALANDDRLGLLADLPRDDFDWQPHRVP